MLDSEPPCESREAFYKPFHLLTILNVTDSDYIHITIQPTYLDTYSSIYIPSGIVMVQINVFH